MLKPSDNIKWSYMINKIGLELLFGWEVDMSFQYMN